MPHGWDRKEVAGPLDLCWTLLLSVLVGQSLSGSCGLPPCPVLSSPTAQHGPAPGPPRTRLGGARLREKAGGGGGASKAHGIIDGLSLLKGEWGPGVLSAPSSPRRGLCRPQRRAQKGLDPQPGLGELARISSFVLVSRSLGLRPSPLPGPPRPLAWGQQGRWEGIPTLSLLQAGGCCAPRCYSGRCSTDTSCYFVVTLAF